MAFTDIWSICPIPAEGSVIRGDGWRVTVLTDRLLRLEYEPEGRFCDSATQLAINRRFELPEFTARRDDGWLTVETASLRLRYDGRPFSPEGLSVTLKGQFAVYASVWHYGDAGRNLKGTARTLDEADGAPCVGYSYLYKDWMIEISFFYSTQEAADLTKTIMESFRQ